MSIRGKRSHFSPEPSKTATGSGSAKATAKVFADAEAMKEQIHKDIDKQEYDVANFYKETGRAQLIARSNHFGNFTLFTIFLNSLWIGVEIDLNDADQLKDADWYFQAGEYWFCVFFTFEWLVRFTAFKHKIDGFKDRWFCFDTCLVTLMISETFLVPFLLSAGSGGGEGGGIDMGNLGMIRMLRLLRLTRMVRFMRSVPELVTLLKSMGLALRSVGSTLGLLFIFMYIFSIIFTSQLKTDDPYLKNRFGRIPLAIWTLFFSGTLMDNVSQIANALLENSLLLTFVFVVFVFLAAFTVLNMLIGLLCEVVTAVAAAEKEKAMVLHVKSKLTCFLEQLDTDGNGTISKTEFDQLITFPEAVHALSELGVDVQNLVQLSDHLFDEDEVRRVGGQDRASYLDQRSEAEFDELGASAEEEEEGEHHMTFAQFLEMVISLRSNNRPSLLHITDLRKIVMRTQRDVVDQLSEIERNSQRLVEDMVRVSSRLDRFCTRHRAVLSGAEATWQGPMLGGPSTVSTPSGTESVPVWGAVAPPEVQKAYEAEPKSPGPRPPREVVDKVRCLAAGWECKEEAAAIGVDNPGGYLGRDEAELAFDRANADVPPDPCPVHKIASQVAGPGMAFAKALQPQALPHVAASKQWSH